MFEALLGERHQQTTDRTFNRGFVIIVSGIVNLCLSSAKNKELNEQASENQ